MAKVYNPIETNQVFGAPEVKEILGCTITASKNNPEGFTFRVIHSKHHNKFLLPTFIEAIYEIIYKAQSIILNVVYYKNI